MSTFQKIISNLVNFWGDYGCIIHQGHDVEVGAGTFNPATFLRCLGPEPYSAVYIEPSRRPQDGRFGENPNRLQLFHQLQVIVKPSPLDIQEMYLNSLKSIGFDLKDHDIRFVHDDWESPTLGASGLGWEVWLDGMEVTQFTYFQTVAGYSLHPITVEITYGLERLCMALQKKNNFFDMQWNENLTYGDVCHRNEVEWSHYNFYNASTEMWLRHFADFEQEAKSLIKSKLPIPAYDFVMKASHAFNMIEARGVVSVTERTGYITRVRELAKLAAAGYLESREKLGYPLLKKEKKEAKHPPSKTISGPFSFTDRDDFIFEIGSEELPATFIPIGTDQLEKSFAKLLSENNIPYSSLTTFGSPRRLSILVKELAHGTEDTHLEKKGPPVTTAFDQTSQLTVQGKGFFTSLGIEKIPTLDEIRAGKVSTISLKTMNGIEYLTALVTKKGLSTVSILSAHLPKLIEDLHFPKKMRWADFDMTYARPIHWILALFGKAVIPMEITSIQSSNLSHGHSQLCPKTFEIKTPSEYVTTLKKHNVLVDILERKESILEQLGRIEKNTNTHAAMKEEVLKQVLYLSEWPELIYTTFDEKFLHIPDEVLISEMVEHQKYFPLMNASGKLTNFFVITADNTPNETITSGNIHVLSARLADGVFLYKEDLKTSLDAFNEKLQTIILQKDLGTVAEKVTRLKHLSLIISQILHLSDEKTIVRAASLSKADLASELVQEFPNLQGTIGKYYALHQKEGEEIALSIEEHWMPKSEGSPLPSSTVGIILSLADKLDNLTSYFSVGLKPTSSSDPYALRRQAIGIIRILIEKQMDLDIEIILQEACSLHPTLSQKRELIEDVLQFITNRAKGVFEDYGFKKDEIEASLQGKCSNPYDQFRKVEALHAFRKDPSFPDLYEVFKRSKGQIGKESPSTLHSNLLHEKAEKELFLSLERIQKPFNHALKTRAYNEAFILLPQLQKPLADLFDQVKILTDDPKIRSNRLALLQEVLSLFSSLLDFEKIQIKPN